jgi:hypothetical protein
MTISLGIFTLLLSCISNTVIHTDSKRVDIPGKIVMVTGLQRLDRTNNDLTWYVPLY